MNIDYLHIYELYNSIIYLLFNCHYYNYTFTNHTYVYLYVYLRYVAYMCAIKGGNNNNIQTPLCIFIKDLNQKYPLKCGIAL